MSHPIQGQLDAIPPNVTITKIGFTAMAGQQVVIGTVTPVASYLSDLIENSNVIGTVTLGPVISADGTQDIIYTAPSEITNSTIFTNSIFANSFDVVNYLGEPESDDGSTPVSLNFTLALDTTPVIGAPAYANQANDGSLVLTFADSDTNIASESVVVTDQSGQQVTAQFENGEWVANVTGLAQGTLTVTGTETDDGGNTNVATTTLIHDDRITTPVVAAPPYANAATEGNVVLTFTDPDTDIVTYPLVVTDQNGNQVTAHSVNGQWVANVTSLAQGTLTVTGTVTDAAGNTASASTTMIHDDKITTPVVGAPPYANQANEGNVILTFTDPDADIVTYPLVVTDGSGKQVTAHSVNGQWVADVTGLAQGTLTVTGSVTDAAGNTASASTTLIHDDQISTPTITGPADADPTTQSNVTFTVTDPDSDIASGKVVVTDGSGGQVTATAIGPDNDLFSANVTNLAFGTLTATATVIDAAGNIATNAMTFTHEDQATENDTAAPCYCPGTMILSARGEVAVEDLVIGDRLVTRSGEARELKWIGRRAYNRRLAVTNPKIWPVCIQPGALADGVPRATLRVSPEHAMFLDGVLVPAGLLVNGVSITQPEPVDAVQYFHLELDSHNVIWAEGALAESFVDDDSRRMFQNAAEFRALYPDARRGFTGYCAPRVEDGFELEKVYRGLIERSRLPLAA